MHNLQRSERSGFTLMEIMVVIIVIAVLASVAGPMIGTITDQGKASATKASMSNLKTALVNYNNDLGRFPHDGVATASVATVNAADKNALGDTMANNVLVNNSVGAAGGFLNMGIVAYNKRWKGPYMDSDPSDFMMDAWEKKIDYVYHKNQLWLRSAGPDGTSDNMADVTNSNYAGDDIVISLTRVKF
ncbi:MAG: prepilin-type N-terminal cleavage/methylation domain-containing protein [Candidatus Ozemobacteraceae bacterium]